MAQKKSPQTKKAKASTPKKGTRGKGSAQRISKKTAPAQAPKRVPRKQIASKKIAWEQLDLRAAALEMSAALDRAELAPVLIGEACAAWYAPDLTPQVLEFAVREYHVDRMEQLMGGLGFSPRDMRIFTHPAVDWEVTFETQPVLVGDDPVTNVVTASNVRQPLRLLSPTDCVRHRLAAWFRWGDSRLLQQALQVTRLHTHTIDMAAIQRWSEWEWSGDKFRQFLQILDKTSKS